ncbi:MAG: branched-chain amino acid ABC transporter substrate-binding protein [Micromonosporaceae bacterium]
MLLLGVGLVWAFSGDGPEPTMNNSPANTAACDKKLAFFGTLSGRYGPLGVSARNGAKLALNAFRKKNPDCDVELVELDTKDDPKLATKVAEKMAADTSIIGAVGPVYSSEVPTTAPTLAKAGLPTISPAASGTDLTGNGWDTFHRVIGTDASQGPAAAAYLDQIGAERVAVVTDKNPYFKEITEGVEEGLGSNALKTMSYDGADPEYGKMIKYIKKSVIHAVYFSGYGDDAEAFLKKLRAAKLSVRVLAPDTAYDNDIVDTADRLKHFAVSCTCAPPDQVDEDFRIAYEQAYGRRPGNYAAEAYDAANVFLDGIAEDKGSREDMLHFIKRYSERGITKKIKFDSDGEIEPTAPVWFYGVENGRFTYDRRID